MMGCLGRNDCRLTCAPLPPMPTSPAPHALAAAASPAGSPTRSGQRQQKQSGHIDQELLVLEHDDGKRHARELASCLEDYAKKIDQLQEKNRRLEEEVRRIYVYPSLACWH